MNAHRRLTSERWMDAHRRLTSEDERTQTNNVRKRARGWSQRSNNSLPRACGQTTVCRATIVKTSERAPAAQEQNAARDWPNKAQLQPHKEHKSARVLLKGSTRALHQALIWDTPGPFKRVDTRAPAAQEQNAARDWPNKAQPQPHKEHKAAHVLLLGSTRALHQA